METFDRFGSMSESSSKPLNRALFSSNKSDWGTPPDLFQRLHQIYDFTVDGAAHQDNHLLPRWWGPGGEREDALGDTPWGKEERVWLNPPYGRRIGDWLDRPEREALNGTLTVALLPARTGPAWAQRYVIPLIRTGKVTFLPGRLRFVGAEHAAPFDSMVVVFS